MKKLEACLNVLSIVWFIKSDTVLLLFSLNVKIAVKRNECSLKKQFYELIKKLLKN
jgi:hypothetical protein